MTATGTLYLKSTELGVDKSGPWKRGCRFFDNVYVGEYADNRIQKFDSNGNFITKWGSSGFRRWTIRWPKWCYYRFSDNVYVSDYANNRIQKFDSTWNFITTWGSAGSGDGQFNGPRGSPWILLNVYIANYSNRRIQVFAPKYEVNYI